MNIANRLSAAIAEIHRAGVTNSEHGSWCQYIHEIERSELPLGRGIQRSLLDVSASTADRLVFRIAYRSTDEEGLYRPLVTHVLAVTQGSDGCEVTVMSEGGRADDVAYVTSELADVLCYEFSDEQHAKVVAKTRYT